MLNLRLHKRSLVAGVVALAFMLVAAPVSALTITKTATPDKIEGKTGTVTYTVTLSDCEDTVLGCFIFGIEDDETCPAGATGCSDGLLLSECPPALIKAGETYECTYTRAYASDTPAVITDTATAEGFIGLGLAAGPVPFAITDTETVTIKAKPSSGTNTGTTGGTTGSVVTGQNVNVSVNVGNIERRARADVRESSIENEVESEAPDADKIEAQVRNSLR